MDRELRINPRFRWVPLAALAILSPACEDEAPVDVPRDGGAECSGASSGCASGELCFEGRCMPMCTVDLECARTEKCLQGVCVEGNGAPRDAGGPVDGGGPCGSCPEGFICREDVMLCVECMSSDDCDDSAFPVCELATGFCVGAEPNFCNACTETANCSDGMMSFGECVTRTLSGTGRERVCIPACNEGACPPGFRCTEEQCVPFSGCTSFLRGRFSQGCDADEDCVALGDTPAPGQCEGGDPGTPARDGTCLVPCEEASDCVGTMICDGSFCRPM